VQHPASLRRQRVRTAGPHPHRGRTRAQRDDAGLLVLVLVPHGGLEDQAILAENVPAGHAVVRVIEDVSGNWARAFGISTDEGQAQRLITPDAQLAWSHDGSIDAETLGAALREHLVPAPAPQFLPRRPGVAIGRQAPDVLLGPIQGERIPLGQLRGHTVTLCFALPDTQSSLTEIGHLAGDAYSHSLVALILTDTDAADAADVARTLTSDVLITPDPWRLITRTYGVNVWPTTITIDESGLVAATSTGAREGGHSTFGVEGARAAHR
jgi:hypothetical protein